jgi:hypothetical protein
MDRHWMQWATALGTNAATKANEKKQRESSYVEIGNILSTQGLSLMARGGRFYTNHGRYNHNFKCECIKNSTRVLSM